MEIVKFYDKTWLEIPEQDNPAMRDGWQREECVMIFKGQYHRIEDGGFVVAKVDPERNITSIGVFWKKEFADMFAESLALLPKATPVTTEQQFSTTLTGDFTVVVYFDYQPKEPADLTYPGCEASVELNSVLRGIQDIMPVLNESVLSDLAGKCLESMSLHTDA